jgi:hypothetical protein
VAPFAGRSFLPKFVNESGLELFRPVPQQNQITVSTVKYAFHVCAQFHCQVIEVRLVYLMGTKVLIECQKISFYFSMTSFSFIVPAVEEEVFLRVVCVAEGTMFVHICPILILGESVVTTSTASEVYRLCNYGAPSTSFERVESPAFHVEREVHSCPAWGLTRQAVPDVEFRYVANRREITICFKRVYEQGGAIV